MRQNAIGQLGCRAEARHVGESKVWLRRVA